MTTRPFSHLSGEALRTQLKRADTKLGDEIDRLRIVDSQFRAVLDRALALQDEADARRKP